MTETNKQIPVHSFDLWGTLVIQDKLGPKVIRAYEKLMHGKIDTATIDLNVSNYNGVLVGDSKALENKKAIVDTLEDPLWSAYLKGEADVNFEGALYEDCLTVMDDIVNSGEDLCILTTGASPWVEQALLSINPKLALRKVYSGNKAEAQAYEAAAADIAAHDGRMISHTEDQLKGLAGLLQSELKKSVNIIYVERASLATSEEITAQGILYVTSLTDVPYIQMSGQNAMD